ncbi:TPA: cell division protein FtsQ, partial [Clostridioides difficile]|nr:cell division protein FtsQ [Clostridioides difficile]
MKKRRKLNTNNVMIVLVFILMLSFCICIIVKSDLFDVKKIDVIGNKRVTKSNIMKE